MQTKQQQTLDMLLQQQTAIDDVGTVRHSQYSWFDTLLSCIHK